MDKRTIRPGAKSAERSTFLDAVIVFCLLKSMGFPGNFRLLLGGAVETLTGYGAFLMEILVMLLTSGGRFLDLRPVNLRRKYAPAYLLVAVFFLESMAVTRQVSAQLISCLHFSVTALFGLWLADRFGPRQLLKYLLIAQAIFVLCNYMLLTALPRIGFYTDEEGRRLFRGITERKNTLGAELAFMLVLQAAALRLRRDRGQPIGFLFWGLLAAQLLLLLITRATGALLTAALPMVYLLWIDRRLSPRGRVHWGVVYAAGSIGFLVFALTVLPLFAPLLEAIGKDATLSNRTVIWRGVLEYMSGHHPLTGNGFSMFWRDAEALKAFQDLFRRDSWYRTMTFGSHNALLELWLEVGLIGVGAYLFNLIWAFRRVKRMSGEQYLFCTAILLPLMIRGLTERAFTPSGYLTMALFLLLGVACNPGEGEPERLSYAERRRRLLAARDGGMENAGASDEGNLSGGPRMPGKPLGKAGKRDGKLEGDRGDHHL